MLARLLDRNASDKNATFNFTIKSHRCVNFRAAVLRTEFRGVGSNGRSARSKHYVSYSRDGSKASNDRATKNAMRAFITGMTFAARNQRGTDREFYVSSSQHSRVSRDNVEIISLTVQSGIVPGKGLEGDIVCKDVRRNVRKININLIALSKNISGVAE